MAGPTRARDYDDYSTGLCERAQLTLLSSAGRPWQDRIFLAGGLVPRYLIKELPPYAKPHVGTTDVDFVVGVAILDDDDPEPYNSLVTNMKKAGFRPCAKGGNPQSWRWQIDIDDKPVVIEFMSEQAGVVGGGILRPKQNLGSKLGAFAVRGASLSARDFVEQELRGRLPNGDETFATMRVANLAPWVTMKALALHDRDKPKDAYDIVFVLGNWPDGPAAAAAAFQSSPVAGETVVQDAVDLLRRHFQHREMDGPGSYARFLFDPATDDEDDFERLRLEAQTTVAEFAASL